MNLDEQKFIENQVKYMYGDYYEKIITNTYIVVNLIRNNDIFVEEVFDNKLDINRLTIGSACQERTQDFMGFLKYFWKKDNKNYIIRSDWNDAVTFVDFILTYNRKYSYKNQVIFPLYHYHLPKSIKINDCIHFKNKQNKLFWRGSSTGSNNIEENIRYKIISRNIYIHPNIDIGFSHLCQNVYKDNTHLFHPLFKNRVNTEEQIQFKFILNIEGNDCASSFPWALSSNCCPLHNYPFSWETYIFGSGLEPYVHFVPINSDGSDLLEKYNWCLSNLDKCEEIANNGKKYMEMYLREDLFNEVIKQFFELYPLIYKN
jgi:hypothetical protein